MREQGINQQPASAPQALHYAPRVGNPNYAAQGVERAQPVLGSQPPLPGAAMVRYIQPKDLNNEGAVVPVNYYGEENGDNASNYASPSSGPYETPAVLPEGNYKMDHNTLWFIANGMARAVGPQGPRPYKSGPQYATAPLGPCFDCGGDHWVRDCPNPKRGR